MKDDRPVHPNQQLANRRRDTFDGYVGCPWRHCPVAATCSASGGCQEIAE
jgi:hypothetical protein